MSRILVLEENANLALGVRRLLELEGHEVVLARDAAAVQARLRAAPPELVILDDALPAARRLLRALRSGRLGRGGAPRVPVLVLGALRPELAGEDDDLAAADGYMLKPFGREELAAGVAALLSPAGASPPARSARRPPRGRGKARRRPSGSPPGA